MKIAITGASGFVGYHLSQYYKYVMGYDVIPVPMDLNVDLSECDLLVHCAGVNRGENIFKDNVEITKKLIDYLTTNNIKIDIKFTSSIQEDLDNDYGYSKKLCKQLLFSYCDKVNSKFTSYKIPNIFGPFCKPNYNSFISTFCYNLVNNIKSNFNSNKVDLIYINDVVKHIALSESELFDNSKINTVVVSEIHSLLEEIHTMYSSGIFPQMDNKFKWDLFNTYRSFTNNSFKFNKHTDERGSLIELIKSNLSPSQVFYSTTKPGFTRGNHFHFSKVERFCVIKGEAEISIRKIGSESVDKIIVNGNDNTVVDMPVLHTHNLKNVGNEDLVCIFWVNEIFDKENPDTYFEVV
tara:strand:- start:1322 stop:2374 length:1053 start_codon:yes stop_codon:yes gene_type:complete